MSNRGPKAGNEANEAFYVLLDWILDAKEDEDRDGEQIVADVVVSNFSPLEKWYLELYASQKAQLRQLPSPTNEEQEPEPPFRERRLSR